MVDWDEVTQGAIAFAFIIGFCAFIIWIVPDPNSKEEQMELCMLNKDNNTRLCELEVEYGEWVRFKP